MSNAISDTTSSAMPDANMEIIANSSNSVASRYILGASLETAWLGDHIDWLRAGSRTIEIKDPLIPNFLDDESAIQTALHQVETVLANYTGQIGIHGPFHDLTIMPRDEQVRQLVIRRLEQGIRFGTQIGAVYMVVHSPFIFYGSPTVCYTDQRELDACIARVHQTLESVLPLMEQSHMTLVIENGVNELRPDPLIALIESFQSDHVRMSLDTGHAFLAHRNGAPPPHIWVRQAGDLLRHLHLQDTDGDRDHHWGPGDGAINWYALFSALDVLKEPPHMIIEVGESLIQRAPNWLTLNHYAL